MVYLHIRLHNHISKTPAAWTGRKISADSLIQTMQSTRKQPIASQSWKNRMAKRKLQPVISVPNTGGKWWEWFLVFELLRHVMSLLSFMQEHLPLLHASSHCTSQVLSSLPPHITPPPWLDKLSHRRFWLARSIAVQLLCDMQTRLCVRHLQGAHTFSNMNVHVCRVTHMLFSLPLFSAIKRFNLNDWNGAISELFSLK